ncbi:hypothetical protein [Dactylosporangium sp. NPDC049140]|uniref:hypothetical protein n=1 Tax=Dactylosporangium sp. NPDC049140 TaxID=3155647 RepID=UPI0034059BBA
MQPSPRLPGMTKRSQRTYMITAQVTVDAAADLTDPVARFAVLRALAAQLTAAPVDLDAPFGAAQARIGLITAVA